MVFTIDEIKAYLKKHKSIEDAINMLSEVSIIDCIETITSLNYAKDGSNLIKYEASIGMARIKDEQQTIYRNSNGMKGKYWMALSPKWIEEDHQKARFKTEYEILYWVNYGDDEVYGWFSVENIRKWLTTPKLRLSELGGTKSVTS